MNVFLGSKPDRKHLVVLNKCRMPEMADLISLFTAKLEETKTSLMSADDMARVHRLQGRAEVLNDFLEAIEQSPSVLERLK
jgi:hypothetical protein